jgi:AraC-like DNA-binding protein
MQFAPLPDPTDPHAPHRYPWGRETIVVHDRTKRAAYGLHTAPLSIKTVTRGEERYRVHGFEETVRPGECLVVNAAQAYESAIEADEPVETLCVFYSAADARDAAASTLADEGLLDDPEARAPAFEFAGVKRASSGALAILLARLPALRHAPLLERQHFGLRLLAAAQAWERPHWAAAAALSAARASTRAELYRRCLIGRACLEASYADEVSLPMLAAAAGLSRTHFLRAYKGCFGETPYRALRRRRLERAAALLRDGNHSVTDAALAVGYGDFSAFARAFKAHHGVQPSALRR